MASEVDICRLALGHLGDRATISSIRPPDGSAQAAHCATFYPIARDSLLEMHDWGFATKRAKLAQVENPIKQWAYCYAAPNDLVNTIGLLDADSADDTTQGIGYLGNWGQVVAAGTGIITPQAFSLESSDDGQDVIYTNQSNALLRYVARVTDTTKFSPLFTATLAAYLASMLAGPLIKGDQGISVAAKWMVIAFGQDGKSGLFGRAASSDAGQKRTTYQDRRPGGWNR